MAEVAPPSASRLRVSPLLWAFLAYAALTVVFTFPLVLHLSSRLPKDLGDPLLAASILWWNAHVLPLTAQWWDGFGFHPAPGMMAFSEHFLGASLIASPLQWMGFSAITAYNLTFLASFPLCAIAGHLLGWTLTRRHDAAVVCGLVYGFNPYRVAHVEHLELLLAFGMPAALAALHLYADTRRLRWLVVFAAALAVQALSGSYYAVFFTIFFGLWIVWFMRPAAWRETLRILAAGVVAVVLLSPVAFGYLSIHDGYSLTRNFDDEVLAYSGDLSSLVTASPLSAAWGWTAVLNGGERQLFPGLTIIALAAAGAVMIGRTRCDRDRLAPVSIALSATAAALVAVAIGARTIGPWQLDWGWLHISVTTPYKPLSAAVAFAIAALASSRAMRHALSQRSALAFYLVAAAVLFLCSLGPRPTLLGEQILYEPPYAWLMRLPVFGDTVRVPARFAMLGILALAAAGSLTFARITAPGRCSVGLFFAVITGILTDGWMRPLPLPAVPQAAFQMPAGDRLAVLELPLGNVWRDTAALYRATLHGARAVNGYNGYEPSYYQVLSRALTNRNDTVLDVLADFGPLVVALDHRVESTAAWASLLSTRHDVTFVSDDGQWGLYRLPEKREAAPQPRCPSNPIAIAAVSDAQGPVDTASLTDLTPATMWMTSSAQRARDRLVLDLGRIQRVCGLVLSMGRAAVLYPTLLSVAISSDQESWKTVFVGRMAGDALRAALANPQDARIPVRLHGARARFLRLQLEASSSDHPWAVADILVDGQP